MRPDDFFIEADEDGLQPRRLNYDLVDRLRTRPDPSMDDLAVAVGLAQLADDELVCYGTEGNETLTNPQIALVIRALTAVLKRLGVDFVPPWRDFSTFKNYWLRNGARGSWQARRDLLSQQFEPLHARLAAMEDQALESNLVQPISPRLDTGWPKVDQEIRELRRRFASASTPQDYRAIGTHCVGVLEALGMTVYDPAKHLRGGETVPPPDKTKQRIGRFIEDALAGQRNEDLRGLMIKAVELAQHVKHSQTSKRREAGVAGDSVILLANILRRIAEEPSP